MKVLFLTWRDIRHPEAGGSERYVHSLAARLSARGHEVTVRSPRPAGLRRIETIDGVRYERAGGRLTVYPRSLLRAVREPRRTVIIDVINGLPFWTGLLPRRRVVALVHHVHRAQWQMIYSGPAGKLGWCIEARLIPVAYRNRPIVTVSEATRQDLRELGYAPTMLHVVRNAVERRPLPPVSTPRSEGEDRRLRLVVLSRLVPHKQIEHALITMMSLAPRFQGLTLDIVGEGWWRGHLENQVEALGISPHVTFHGAVSESTKWEILENSALMLMPSVKEGWCLAVSEAGQCEVPTIGYRSSGGLNESVIDGETGWLVEDLTEMIRAAEAALRDPALLRQRGRAARRHSEPLDGGTLVQEFENVLAAASQRSPY